MHRVRDIRPCHEAAGVRSVETTTHVNPLKVGLAMAAATDHAGLVVLSFDECLELMASSGVGRLAFLADGEIEVLPVNYTIDGARVAFRTATGTKLDAAIEQAVVAFEVDAFDPSERTGWSVVIKGRAEVVSDEALWPGWNVPA